MIQKKLFEGLKPLICMIISQCTRCGKGGWEGEGEVGERVIVLDYSVSQSAAELELEC